MSIKEVSIFSTLDSILEGNTSSKKVHVKSSVAASKNSSSKKAIVADDINPAGSDFKQKVELFVDSLINPDKYSLDQYLFDDDDDYDLSIKEFEIKDVTENSATIEFNLLNPHIAEITASSPTDDTDDKIALAKEFVDSHKGELLDAINESLDGLRDQLGNMKLEGDISIESYVNDDFVDGEDSYKVYATKGQFTVVAA